MYINAHDFTLGFAAYMDGLQNKYICDGADGSDEYIDGFVPA